MRDTIVDVKKTFGNPRSRRRMRASVQDIGEISRQVPLQGRRMLLSENGMMCRLEFESRLCVFRTGELLMQNYCSWFVDYSQTASPQAHAVIGFLVISRLEGFVETAKLLPDRARRHQESCGTVVDVSSKHV